MGWRDNNDACSQRFQAVPTREKMDFGEQVKQRANPREKANVFSIAFFWWVNKLVGDGYNKELQSDDLYTALEGDRSEVLGNRLEAEWNKELKKRDAALKRPYKPSLFKALVRTFGREYAFLGFFTFIEECILRIYQPIFMAWFIRYFSPENTTISRSEAYAYGTGIVLMSAGYTFTHHPYFFGVMHVGMKVRVAACSLLYRKALKLSKGALGQNTVGQMVNLLSNDVNRFDYCVLFIHYLWCGPVQLLLVMYLTWESIGPSTLVGGAMLILFAPLQSWIGKVFSKLRHETAKKTDARIGIMNEIINGIKVIKMYTWEFSFAKLVAEARKNEIDVIRRTANYRSFNFSFFMTSSRLIMMCTFITYVVTGEVLTAEKAFLTLGLYNVVRLSMTLFFPFAIQAVSESKVSIKRMQDFLTQEEITDISNDVLNHDTEPAVEEQLGIDLRFVCGKWNKEEKADTLSNVTFDVRPGNLCAIIGGVGSGKSSILQALLGELPTHSGSIDIKGCISYASQEPWVFSGSVRQNILFGQPWNEKRYWKVIQTCALEHDLTEWEYGDMTLVGERGVSLSGGQKARVSLARAVYKQADIYLLDDPLSAVDAHVGKHLFDECMKGFLGDKIVVLVTHQLQYLKDANNIIVLKDGMVVHCGSYNKLVRSGTDLAEYLAHEEQEEEEEEETDVMEPHGRSLSITAEEFRKNLLNVERRRSRALSTSSYISRISEQEFMGTFDNQTMNMQEMEEEEEEEKKMPKQVEETRNVGSVTFKTYMDYFKAGGTGLIVFINVLLNLIVQGLFISTDVWISKWTNEEELKLRELHSHTNETLTPPIISTSTPSTTNLTTVDLEQELITSNYLNLIIFCAMVMALVVFSFVRTLCFFRLCINASKNLHNQMFSCLIRAPCRFFDTNPVGRILNRFTKDMGSMDELLPNTLVDVIFIFLNVLGYFAIVFYVKPVVIVPTLGISVIFYYLRRLYMKTSRSVKRLEGIAKSPVFSQLSTSLHGLTTVRAFQAQDILIEEFDKIQDTHSSAWFCFLATTRWFGLWLDWIVVVYLAFCVYSFLVLDGQVFGGEVGVVIVSVIQMTGAVQWGMRQSAETENLMVAVERIMEYGDLPSEAPLETKEEDRPKDEKWPAQGEVEFDEVYLRYAEEDKYVLKGLTFKTKMHEKIGIVGRTGAGKSSTVAALFRLAEPKGRIVIDGVNIQKLGLHDLRKNISIIPQDPLLFTESLRKNLDPFDEYEDAKIWRALEEANLSSTVREMKDGLETRMSEGGSNLSVGQRQLVCLARAILRQNTVLILDEATANVDPRTDSLIQETIRTQFSKCTVLTIAHRLHTVMDSDRMLVLSDGKVEEYDEPYKLLRNPTGIFTQLVNQTGESTKEKLTAIAEEAHRLRMVDETSNATATHSQITITFEDEEQENTKL